MYDSLVIKLLVKVPNSLRVGPYIIVQDIIIRLNNNKGLSVKSLFRKKFVGTCSLKLHMT